MVIGVGLGFLVGRFKQPRNSQVYHMFLTSIKRLKHWDKRLVIGLRGYNQPLVSRGESKFCQPLYQEVEPQHLFQTLVH